jgi:hypothetical protein
VGTNSTGAAGQSLKARKWILLFRISTALTFAALMARFIWRVEWFDVLRWGIPSFQVLAVYAAYISAAGAFGWFVATLGTPNERLRRLRR